jgi:predicted Zn-dependent protease
MASEAMLREVAKSLLAAAKKARADEAEVHLANGREALTRFAGNEIHQNVESTRSEASLRLVYMTARGIHTARTGTTRLDAKGLEDLVARTAEVAKLAPFDAEYLPVVDPAPGSALVRFPDFVDKATDELSPGDRAAAVKRVVDAVAKAGFDAAGYLSSGRGSNDGTYLLANSRGLVRSFERTNASFSITVQAKDSSGWAEASSWRIGAIDVDALAARAIEKAKLSADPGEVEPGDWDVILEPSAVRDLTDFLFWGGFSGRTYEEGDTWSAGQLGKKVFGDNVTFKDDWTDARNPGMPFDEEGLAREKLLLVEKGVMTGLAWDRRSAKKAGTVATGHGYRVPNLWGGGPGNVVMDGGTTSTADMIASTKKGILVTHFWYNRLVDPMKVIVTGMTRDGTFLVENGKVTRGVKNMRFNQSVIELLKNIRALGPTDPSFMVPAIQASGFRFSSKTRF